MTLIFYDWEFYENGSTIDPISLGMVSEFGSELYLVNEEFNWDSATDWLKENVQPNLYIPTEKWITQLHCAKGSFPHFIKGWISEQVEPKQSIQLIGYYADYDHVLLAQQFGTMMELPEFIPMWTRDIKQWCDDLGDPRLPEQSEGEHNALLDARFIRDTYNWLKTNYRHPAWSKK